MPYQYISEALFYVFVLLVLFGSLLAVRARILMHSVLGLAVTLLGVAGIYFYLGSMFLTLMQVLIYVGAICVVLVFGIMVGYTPEEEARRGEKGRPNLLLSLLSAATGFGLLVLVMGRTVWEPFLPKTGNYSLDYLGESLLYQYCLAFELISVVLLIAIIGSIILARGTRKEDDEKAYFMGATAPRTIRRGGKRQ